MLPFLYSNDSRHSQSDFRSSVFACGGHHLGVVSHQRCSVCFPNLGVSTYCDLKTRGSKSDRIRFNSDVNRDPRFLCVSVQLGVKPATVIISGTGNGLSGEPKRGGQPKHTSKKRRLAEVEKVVRCLVEPWRSERIQTLSNFWLEDHISR